MLRGLTLCAALALGQSVAQLAKTAPDADSGATTQADPTRAEQRRAAAALQEADEHVVSQSRMFSVSGGDSLRMGAIATKADEVRGSVCRLLGIDTTWKYGISIRLIGSSSDRAERTPIRTRISIIGGEPNFQIRIYPGGGINVERLTNAIITMTLFERALSNQRADALPDTVNIPHWLITGVQQAVLWRSGKGDRRLYRSLFERADMLTIEEIVSTKDISELDASSRQVYEVSCGVLVMCLLHREGGPAQLRELIAESALSDGTPREIISAHFHELGVDSTMLNKWWALELAALAQAPATEMLTPMETEKQLEEALTILLYDAEKQAPQPLNADNVYALLEQSEWRAQIPPLIERLMQLNLHCFPGYRAIIAEYCRAYNELLKGGTADDVQNILGPLRELRAAYITTSLRARDYLDWYEITHLGENKHKEGFADYQETMRLLRREKTGPDTHMSRYLQDIENLYSLKSGEELPDSLMEQVRRAHNEYRKSTQHP